ncbi:NAD(P)/FAD-dependent oxidoreductase [Oscillibacter sp. MSJ-2]|uniref:NAD(P)/FAD-dependent oxidoreductase n=1 Tax=Dysosmobacter acutus TaxID=2841504 RepID=A0ABS6FCF8_9FIRM|nr:FAD-dependent oxidoreductase [Dysosmobacter acutus]MBU5627024.1 NAD(P)/FAD-dependent oxidoreductase [Dysosmobacter acutus]
MFIFGGPDYDLIIVGSGPAGMTAAVYARRSGKTVLVIEKEKFGGQITSSPKVENFPGRLSMAGSDFANDLLHQAMENGAEFVLGTVTAVAQEGDFKSVTTEEGECYSAKAVILANGVKHRVLDLPGERELIGNGVHFCVVCDGNLYAGKKAAIIGGGNSALQEAVMLSELAAELLIVQNLAFLTGEQQLIDLLESRSNVKIIYSTVVSQYKVESGKLTGLTLKSETDGRLSEVACDGCFLAVGLVPENEQFSPVAKLDERGYYIADESCFTETEGLFVAGDCRQKAVRQLTTAASDGAVAALAACRYIDNH